MIFFKAVSKNQLAAIIFIFLFLAIHAKLDAQEKVIWLSWEEAIEKSKVEKKKIFVDVFTKWCGWCKKMDKTTFQKPMIAAFLNENYYPVKFDAEQREEIDFKDKTHKFVRSGRRGYNTLAVELTKGRLSYPTIVFLDEELNVIQPIPGYRGPGEFEMIMTYFAGDHYKTIPWKLYSNTYEPMEKKSNKYSRTVNYKNH